MEVNEKCLDSLCASLCDIIDIEPPKEAAKPCNMLTEYAENAFKGEKADRIFMYNPDAVAEWIVEKYPHLVKEVSDSADIKIPFQTMMPSVTPVCFGTMYTGAKPEIHGIMAYEKPVIKIDTIFDSLIRAGKKCAICSTEGDSLSKIFLEREMDYFIYDTIGEVNAKAAELIIKDEHDFILVYNGNYDATMHKFAPESAEALAELRANVEAFAMFDALIRNHWQKHNSFIGFATDHGCHEIDGNCGSHGLSMTEDLNIVHFYKGYPKSN